MPDVSVLIKWIGSSVSGLVVIAGIVCLILYALFNKPELMGWGIAFVILGLLGAVFMTFIIRATRY